MYGNELGKRNKVIILWDNEITDNITKGRTGTPFAKSKAFYGISASAIMKRLKCEVEQRNCNYGKNFQKIKQARSLLGIYNSKWSMKDPARQWQTKKASE